jgi:alanine-glyoxylate transaminase/serine-glyoxylate transaminase/serine-pyruvate transaminase
MLPPGLSFNAVSQKALAASKQARLPRAFGAWDEIIEAIKNGFWSYTAATNLLYGLSEACDMLLEEGLQNVFARHQRHAEATRQCVRAWGLEILCQNPAEYSGALTAVVMPYGPNGERCNADALRKVILTNFNMSLGQGLNKLSGWVFRIGHLGDFNDLTLMGTLAGVEMGLAVAGVPHKAGGVAAAMQSLRETLPGASGQQAACTGGATQNSTVVSNQKNGHSRTGDDSCTASPSSIRSRSQV